jgi:DNA-directed RNA polymerase specialized sigma24 family protein
MDKALLTWIRELSDGDELAAQAIWDGYFDKLVRLARWKLGGVDIRVADEEDVALSAMNSFVRGARTGKYSLLSDKDDLWKLLVTITARKVIAHQRRHFAQKRGSGLVRGESAFVHYRNGDPMVGMAEILGSEPTPEFAAQFAEQVEKMLERLADPLLREIALLRLEGYEVKEIAAKINRTSRTVERKLRLIRGAWEDWLDQEH